MVAIEHVCVVHAGVGHQSNTAQSRLDRIARPSGDGITRPATELSTDIATNTIRFPGGAQGRTLGGSRRLNVATGIQRWIWHRLQQLPDVAELT